MFEWLNIEDKYWYSSDDLILVASKVNGISTGEELFVDTLFLEKSTAINKVNDLNWVYNGIQWESKRTELKGVYFKNGVYQLYMKDMAYPHPGAECIFVFDERLNIIGAVVAKIDPEGGYR